MNLKKIENFLSKLLLFGVLSSSICIITGIILSFNKNIPTNWNYNQLISTNKLISFDSSTFFSLGIFILILIPIIRILSMLVQFIYLKNKNYIVISVLVLAILFISFMLGASH